MSGPSPGRPRLWRGRGAALLLSAGAFLILLLALPRWSRRIRCDEAIEAQTVTDDSSTLVAFSVRLQRTEWGDNLYTTWPIRLFDVATGQERIVTRPEDSAGTAEVRDEYGGRYRVAGKQTLHTTGSDNGIEQSGDLLALTYETIDLESPEKRLQVLNWRTGAVLLDGPFEGECRFFGPRLLVTQHDGGSRLEIWTPAKKTIERADWLIGFEDFHSTLISPDGRWLVFQGPTRLWDIDGRKEHFKLFKEAEAPVFSPDSSRLVLVGQFGTKDTGRQVRSWQSLDTQTGRVLREEQETIDWPDNRSPPRGPGHLRFLSDGETVRYDKRGGATEWSPRGFRRLEESPAEDVYTADKLLGEEGVEWVAGANGNRAVTSQVQQPAMRNLYNRLVSLVFPQAQSVSSSQFPYQLWDVKERRRIASLGRGSAECCWFTPDGRRVVTQADRELFVWDLPPGLPWGRAFLWSLPVPLAASLVAFGRSRRNRAGVRSA